MGLVCLAVQKVNIACTHLEGYHLIQAVWCMAYDGISSHIIVVLLVLKSG